MNGVVFNSLIRFLSFAVFSAPREKKMDSPDKSTAATRFLKGSSIYNGLFANSFPQKLMSS